MSDYSADHASALADIAAAGSAVSFAYTTGASYNESTDVTTGATPATMTGQALGVKGNQRRYAELNLVTKKRATLLFAPTTLGDEPPLGSAIVWGSETYTVRSVDDPVALNGSLILARIVIAK